MKIRHLDIQDVVEITPSKHEDHRGYFSETFRDDFFRREVADLSFVQENQSLSRSAGVVRGLHYQVSPHAQGKLVRCVAGAIFDVAVDLRRGSPSFGKWVTATLTAEEGNQLWIPAGFGHGFCTLVPDCIVSYKVTDYYNRDADMGVAWDDPEIAIAWPEIADPANLSSKDANQPTLRSAAQLFTFAGQEA